MKNTFYLNVPFWHSVAPYNKKPEVDKNPLLTASSGELVGHRDLVSGFSFCQHPGQNHICVSSSSDGSVRFWDSASRLLIREHAAHQVSTRLNPHFDRLSICPVGGGQMAPITTHSWRWLCPLCADRRVSRPLVSGRLQPGGVGR